MTIFNPQSVELISDFVIDTENRNLDSVAEARRRWSYEEYLPVEIDEDISDSSSGAGILIYYDEENEEWIKPNVGEPLEVEVRTDFSGAISSGDRVLVRQAAGEWQVLTSSPGEIEIGFGCLDVGNFEEMIGRSFTETPQFNQELDAYWMTGKNEGIQQKKIIDVDALESLDASDLTPRPLPPAATIDAPGEFPIQRVFHNDLITDGLLVPNGSKILWMRCRDARDPANPFDFVATGDQLLGIDCEINGSFVMPSEPFNNIYFPQINGVSPWDAPGTNGGGNGPHNGVEPAGY